MFGGIPKSIAKRIPGARVFTGPADGPSRVTSGIRILTTLIHKSAKKVEKALGPKNRVSRLAWKLKDGLNKEANALKRLKGLSKSQIRMFQAAKMGIASAAIYTMYVSYSCKEECGGKLW